MDKGFQQQENRATLHPAPQRIGPTGAKELAMNQKTLGVGLLVVGGLLFLVSAAADTIGVGAAPGFGWKQITGVIAGVVLAAVGASRLRPANRG